MAALEEWSDHTDISVDDIKPFLRTGFPWHEPEKAHPELSLPGAWWNHMEGFFRTVFEKLGIDRRGAQHLARRTHEIYIDEKRYQIFPGTIETLGRLKESGWVNVILSNHVPELPDMVNRLGLSGVIEKCFISALIGDEKPNIMAFRYVLDALRHPDTCVMGGDNIRADIEGADRAGILPILLHTPATDGTVRCCRTIAEVADQLQDIGG